MEEENNSNNEQPAEADAPEAQETIAATEGPSVATTGDADDTQTAPAQDDTAGSESAAVTGTQNDENDDEIDKLFAEDDDDDEEEEDDDEEGNVATASKTGGGNVNNATPEGVDEESSDEEQQGGKRIRKKKLLKKKEKGRGMKRTKDTSKSKRHRKRAKKSTEGGDEQPQDRKREEDESDEYEEEEDGPMTKEDEQFIDRTGDDEELIQEYEQMNQNFQDERPDRGQQQGDNYQQEEEESETLKAIRNMGQKKKSGKPKKKKNEEDTDDAEKQDMVRRLFEEMIAAAEQDARARENKQMAVRKLQLLPKVWEAVNNSELHETLLEGTRFHDGRSISLLQILREWLRPNRGDTIPTRTLRNEIYKMVKKLNVGPEHLRMSKIGEVLMILWHHPDETDENKRLLRPMIEGWMRPIFQKTDSYRRVDTSIEAEQAAERETRKFAQQIARSQPAHLASQYKELGSMKDTTQQMREQAEKAQVKGTRNLKAALAGVSTEHGTTLRTYHAHKPSRINLDRARPPKRDQSAPTVPLKQQGPAKKSSELSKKLRNLKKNSGNSDSSKVSITGHNM